jgi:hypothetical protein
MHSAATQWLYCAVAALMVLSVVITLLPARANAYNQVSSRSILMSSSAAGATNVAYQVNFTTVTNNQTVGSVVVEVCGNSPIIGDTCTAPSGFSFNKASLTVNNISGNITSLSVDSSSNSTANRIVLTRTAGTVANGPVSFTLGNGTSNGITNPTSTVGTFYARILILASTDGTLPGSSTNENDATDAGGVAISTANQLHVTAKVQESLLFCVYTDVDCATGGNDVKLGDLNGVLASNSTTYTGSANFDVASNAVSGVSIHLKGTTLTSGSFTIDPAGSSCIADPTSSSTEMFGLRMLTLPTGMTSTAPYNCASGNHAFDANTSTGIPSTFGQEIAHTTGASDILTSTIEFAAKSALTSEAGVYTTTLTLIATATY